MSQSFGLEALKRFATLKTHTIYTLPIVILMPHSGCNCQCVMCDIWRGNANPRLLTEADVAGLLDSLLRLGTRWVVMSGGEALLNPNLFRLCAMLRAAGLKITILSTGLLLTRYARELVAQTDEVIVSLDGPEPVHDAIRRIPQVYRKLAQGVQAVRAINPAFPVAARCVIQRLNFAHWPAIVNAARTLGLNSVSFLPADVSSTAFNRPQGWDTAQTADVLPDREQLPQLKATIEALIEVHAADFAAGFIVESPAKIRRIYDYYAAHHGLANFPPVRCNAPWVSVVVEADGAVRPCFFHPVQGNIRQAALPELLNGAQAVAFRRGLDMDTNPVCRQCVCSLNLRPTVQVGP
jgi:MoaA/NifB/PqqE/SkfB family radical SAM enzyme